jgi:hypothetical protein
MSKMRPLCFDAGYSARSAPSDVLLREEPAEEEDDEEEDDRKEDDDDGENDEGYSE